MSHYSLEPHMLYRASADLNEASQAVLQLNQRLASARSAMKLSAHISKQIDKVLSDAMEQIGMASKSLDDFGKILRSIITAYEHADQSLITNILTSVVASHSQASSSINHVAVGLHTHTSYNVFGKSNSYTFENRNGGHITFHEGTPTRPRWEAYKDYDCFYPYDPDVHPEAEDYLSWVLWSGATPFAAIVKDVPDGVMAYEHYRKGTGDELWIDYSRAYQEDNNIKQQVDNVVLDTNTAIWEMVEKGQEPPLSVSSELVPMSVNPSTENWQKTIGRHQVWVSSDVIRASDGAIVVKTTVHEIDRYNFNKGESDIATSIPDAVNGRFETLGWAKSFNTYGEIGFETSMKGAPAGNTAEVVTHPKTRARHRAVS